MSQITLKTLLASSDWADALQVCDPPVATEGFRGATTFALHDVKEVLAIDEVPGDFAELDLLGVFRTHDDRIVKVAASCDSTGWDCQAGGRIEIAATLQDMIRWGLTETERQRLGWSGLFMGPA